MDGDLAPQALLPLEIDRLGPARIARFAGSKHANFGMPLLDRSFARQFDPADIPALMRALGEAHGGIDLFALTNQPLECDGVRNPFAQAPNARMTPGAVFRTVIDAGGADVAERVVSKSSRKKLAAKARKLSELGEVFCRRAATEAEARAFLDAFFAQKKLRSAALRLPDPFVEPQARRFLRRAATAGIEHGAAAFDLYAMTCGDAVAAVFGAATNGQWLSGSIISHSPDPAFERCSPGELLLLAVLRDAGARGFESFDLGVGGGAYKASFCKDPFAAGRLLHPVTMRGIAAAPLLAGAGVLKAAIKRDARLLRMAQRFGRSG